MHFLASNDLSEKTLANKYIFLDNDFLSVLFRDFEALEDIIVLSKKGYLLIDPFTKFEFLRSVFLPAQRELKEEFLKNDDIFLPAADHQTIFTQVRDNALKLSYVYAHKNCATASLVDLFLASRALLHSPKALIITGNKKDFPSFLFDTVGILNYEEEKSFQIRSYSVVSFSITKYQKCVSDWESIP